MTAVQLRGQLGNTNKGYNGNSIDEGVFLFVYLFYPGFEIYLLTNCLGYICHIPYFRK
jgi:hypothetical protein